MKLFYTIWINLGFLCIIKSIVTKNVNEFTTSKATIFSNRSSNFQLPKTII